MYGSFASCDVRQVSFCIKCLNHSKRYTFFAFMLTYRGIFGFQNYFPLSKLKEASEVHNFLVYDSCLVISILHSNMNYFPC